MRPGGGKQSLQLPGGQGGGGAAPHIQGVDGQAALLQNPAGVLHLLQHRRQIGLHQLQSPAHVGGHKGAVGAPGGTEGNPDVQGHLVLPHLPVHRQAGLGAVHRQLGPEGGHAVLPLQLGLGLLRRAPRQHTAGGQLHRAHPGEGPPGGLLAQHGGPRPVESHLKSVLEGVVHPLRGLVQKAALHLGLALGGPLGAGHPGGHHRPVRASVQGKDRLVVGRGVPLRVLRALPGEQHEHHLLHRVFVALRLPVVILNLKIQLHNSTT